MEAEKWVEAGNSLSPWPELRSREGLRWKAGKDGKEEMLWSPDRRLLGSVKKTGEDTVDVVVRFGEEDYRRSGRVWSVDSAKEFVEANHAFRQHTYFSGFEREKEARSDDLTKRPLKRRPAREQQKDRSEDRER